mgnify:FL=1
MAKNLFVILGNQLFDPGLLKSLECDEVFMAEDFKFCTYQKHHKLKLYLFLTAMREYKEELEKHNLKVTYFKLDDRIENESYLELLDNFLKKKQLNKFHIFEIEDKPFETEIKESTLLKNKEIIFHTSPMFLFSREEFKALHVEKEVFRMSSFYTHGRKKMNVLIDKNKKPEGGKWSYDEENRKKIPKDTPIPNLTRIALSGHHSEVCKTIQDNFNSHPGVLENFWFPVTRKGAKKQLKNFLNHKIRYFGTYEDAMLSKENFLFHSGLSSSLNIGLISPEDVIKETIKIYKKNSLPLNSVEGFIRQILGWREFIRGVYQIKGEDQQKINFWEHKKQLKDSWYEGTTGIDPLDDCIKLIIQDGYHHHIPRLMIISNLMNMCEVSPHEIYKWFMEMFIDSSDWVMVPNVYGMATYSDGGIMSTKPYTCGSNYILKMSNYPKGEWCDIVDGLYWKFSEKHRSFFEKNARMNFLTRTLDRMNEERKEMIFSKATKFVQENTI